MVPEDPLWKTASAARSLVWHDPVQRTAQPSFSFLPMKMPAAARRLQDRAAH